MKYDISIDAIEIVAGNKLPLISVSSERAIEKRNKMREEIAGHVAQYLESGGTINVIPPGKVNFTAQFDPSEQRRNRQAAKV